MPKSKAYLSVVVNDTTILVCSETVIAIVISRVCQSKDLMLLAIKMKLDY